MSRKHNKKSIGEKMRRTYLNTMNAQAEKLATLHARRLHANLRNKLCYYATAEYVTSENGLAGLAILLADKEHYSLAFNAKTLALSLVFNDEKRSIALDMNSIFEQVANYVKS